MDESTRNEIIREFYLYRRSRRDTLGEFLAHYHRLWVEASRCGVLGVDGIIHLISLLPLEWREWAISIIPEYIGMQLWRDDLYGDCRGFIAAIISRYICYGEPPPGPYSSVGILPIEVILELLARDDPTFCARQSPTSVPESEPSEVQHSAPPLFPTTNSAPYQSHLHASDTDAHSRDFSNSDPLDSSFQPSKNECEVGTSRLLNDDNEENNDMNDPTDEMTVGTSSLRTLSPHELSFEISPFLFSNNQSTTLLSAQDEMNRVTDEEEMTEVETAMNNDSNQRMEDEDDEEPMENEDEPFEDDEEPFEDDSDGVEVQ